MVCNARKAAVARMAERATPLTVPAHVLTVGKASIVAKGVAKTPRHMDPIVLSSVLVTGTTLSCKCLLLPPCLLAYSPFAFFLFFSLTYVLLNV